MLTIDSQVADQNFYLDARKSLLNQIVSNLNHEDDLANYYSGSILSDLIGRNSEINSWKELVMTLITPENLKVFVSAATSNNTPRITASLNVLKGFFSSSVRYEFLKPAKAQSSDEDGTVIQEEETPEFIKGIVSLFTPLTAVLGRKSEEYTNTNKKTVKILGEDRLKIVEFVLACIKADLKEINVGIKESKVLVQVIDLFFIFELNSLLHSLVDQIISATLSSSNSEEDIKTELLIESKLIEKLISSEDNKGYTGYVIKISNNLSKASESNEAISQALSLYPTWKNFQENYLSKKTEIEKKTLGDLNNPHPDDLSSDDTPNEDLYKKSTDGLTSYSKVPESSDSYAEIEEEDKNDKPMGLDELEVDNKTKEKDLSAVEQQPDEEPNQSKEKKNEFVDENLLENEEEAEKEVKENLTGYLTNLLDPASKHAKNLVEKGFEYVNKLSDTEPNQTENPFKPEVETKEEEKPIESTETPEETKNNEFIEGNENASGNLDSDNLNEPFTEEPVVAKPGTTPEITDQEYWRFG